jgi:hypothetical protein
MEKLYPTSATARKKGCPRGAFLGLCEAGLVKGIPAGRYAASKDSKAYAVRAAELLAEGTQSWSTSALWKAVSNDPEKTHNSQAQQPNGYCDGALEERPHHPQLMKG